MSFVRSVQAQPVSSAAAVRHALNEVRYPDKSYKGLCDHFVARMYGRSHSGHYSARTHWNAMPDKYKHTGNSPMGALQFWQVGKHWHVAIDVGYGVVASNDILRLGKIDVVKTRLITSKWNARYLGWTNPWF